jgi:hypothetical protein
MIKHMRFLTMSVIFAECTVEVFLQLSFVTVFYRLTSMESRRNPGA